MNFDLHCFYVFFMFFYVFFWGVNLNLKCDLNSFASRFLCVCASYLLFLYKYEYEYIIKIIIIIIKQSFKNYNFFSNWNKYSLLFYHFKFEEENKRTDKKGWGEYTLKCKSRVQAIWFYIFIFRSHLKLIYTINY